MAAELHFRLDDLRDPRIALFLQEHLNDMRRVSPSESVHALDLDGLRRPDIRFWTAWLDTGDGARLAATAALTRLDAQHVELKSMRTAADLRGQGIAARVLAQVLGDARSDGYARISLEIGSQDVFAPARALYARNGFATCAPFGSLWGGSGQLFHDPHRVNAPSPC